MKKKTVKMLLSLCVLAALGGVYFGVQKYTANLEKQEEEEKEETEKVISVSSQDLSSVKFMIDKKEVTFKKDGDNWIKEDEPDFPVDQDKITETFGNLNEMEADRVLEDVDNLQEYGLDVPENTITVVSGDDDAQTVLKIGSKNDSTNQYYVEKDGDESKVYVVASSVLEPFTKKLYDYAKMNTFPTVDNSKIQQVTVNGTDGSYTLKKDSDSGLWNVDGETGEDKADTSKADTVASSVSSISYDSLVDYNCEDLEKYGLDKPTAEITVSYQVQTEDETSDDSTEKNSDETEDEQEKNAVTETETEEKQEDEPVLEDRELTIQVGNEVDDDYYVCVFDGENDENNTKTEVYTISKDTIDGFIGKTEADFWDMTVDHVYANALDSLELEYQGEKHVINVSRETSEDEKDSDQSEDSDSKKSETTTYQLDGAEIDSTSFSKVFNKLSNMIGQKRLMEKFTPAKDAELKAHYKDVDGDQIEVEFYAYDTNFYAVQSGEKVYLVNKMNVKELMDALDDLLDSEANDEASKS